jgi:hypothetical protein
MFSKKGFDEIYENARPDLEVQNRETNHEDEKMKEKKQAAI